MNIAERVRQGDSAARLVVRCLGRFRLEDQHGNQLQLRTRKARALLAALALGSKAMARDRLADLLWSDRGEAQARSSLRQTIFELQHFESAGAPILAAGRDDLAVRQDQLVTDTQLIRCAAVEGDWPRLLSLLGECEQGLLNDLDGLDPEFDDWLRQQRAQEPARTLAAAISAAERCLAEVGPRAALDIVTEILRLDPVNEEATRLGLRVDHELGDSRALHRRFEQLRTRLREEMGAEPSAGTVALFRQLANGGSTSGPSLPISTEGAAERPPSGRHARYRLLIPAILLIVAALVTVAFLLRDRGAPAATSLPIVAVLPFQQQPPDRSFLAEGLWEQTRAALTRNAAVRVLGRATTEAMARRALPPAEYLKRLGVTHLLEGHVRRSGDNLLVSVSLTRTEDGLTVWHDMFRGRMGEPFALQDRIANGIEGKLRARLAPDGGRRAEQITTTPEVYALYSEARQLISSRDRANFRRAEALLRDAVRADPNYAPAWSLLGGAIHFNGRIAIVDEKARAEGLAAVRRALSMAPNFAQAHATLALIQGESTPESERRLRRAVALDPSYSEAWNWLGNSLMAKARYREARQAYERALEIDPLLHPAVSNLSALLTEMQDWDAADRLTRRTTTAGGSPELIIGLKADQFFARGDLSASLELLRQHGLTSDGRAKRLLWLNWFETLTATGYLDELHGLTGCPDWYAPMLAGKALPPRSFEGKPVTPEEFWTSQFFSTPATRTMIRMGREPEVIRLYRAGFRNADDFVSRTDQRDMLPELAANLSVALQAEGFKEEAFYLLGAASQRLEQVLKQSPSRAAIGRLAVIRAAQGDTEESLRLLKSALDKGVFPDGRNMALDLAQEPAFRSLRGDPRFETARKRILDHIAKERAELGPLKA